MLINFLIAATTFSPAVHMDANFVAKTVRIFADQTYAATQFNHGMYANGVAIRYSQMTLDFGGEQWQVLPFCTDSYGRQDVVGMIYGNQQHNKIVVAWHGSYWLQDWLTDLQFAYADGGQENLRGNLHTGFSSVVKNAYSSMRESLQKAMTSCNLRDPEIIFTGHSLGGALAVVSTAKYAADPANISTNNQIKTVTFSAPCVGDQIFVDYLHQLVQQENILQFYCSTDVVPNALSIANGLLRYNYQHAGIHLEIETTEHWISKTTQGLEYLRGDSDLNTRLSTLQRMMDLAGRAGHQVYEIFIKKPVSAAAMLLKFDLLVPSIIMNHELPTYSSTLHALSRIQNRITDSSTTYNPKTVGKASWQEFFLVKQIRKILI